LNIFAQHRENPTQKYNVHCSIVLETPAKDDDLVEVVVNTVNFLPKQLKNISNFSVILANNNFDMGSFPHLNINPRDPILAVERTF
jgi:hypothetical protein